MGTEFISQEIVFASHDTPARPTGQISVKRGSYGSKGMLLIHLSSDFMSRDYQQVFLQEKQVIALIQILAATLDYSPAGHTPHPVRWPQTEIPPASESEY
jgi:hypothetical protein